jgi:hypothetical protein
MNNVMIKMMTKEMDVINVNMNVWGIALNVILLYVWNVKSDFN